MSKKFLIILGILGALTLIGGLLLHPSLLAKLKSSGNFQSEWTVAQIYIVRIFLMLIGAFLIISTIIISRSPAEKRNKQRLITLIAFGFMLAIVGVILTPEFVEKNFSSLKFLEDHNMETLVKYSVINNSLRFSNYIIFIYNFSFKILERQKVKSCFHLHRSCYFIFCCN